jgi:hypothetical protein
MGYKTAVRASGGRCIYTKSKSSLSTSITPHYPTPNQYKQNHQHNGNGHQVPVKGKMQWGDFEPKKWTEDDVDIQIDCCGICGSDLHMLKSGWGPTPYRRFNPPNTSYT